jgi:hypothetical protein
LEVKILLWHERRFLLDTREKIEQRTDVLARQYAAMHDPKILAELKEMSRQLRESTVAVVFFQSLIACSPNKSAAVIDLAELTALCSFAG